MSNHRNKSKRNLQVNARQGANSRGSNIADRLGGGYHFADTKRDVWTVAGYPEKISYNMFWNMQARFGIAKAGIDKLADKCFQTNPIISDGEYDGKRALTPFEKDLAILIEEHDFLVRYKELYRRNRIGRYAGMVPIVTEINGDAKAQDQASKSRGIKSLLKIDVFGEDEVSVENISTNSNIFSADYGMPTHYNLRNNVAGDRNPIGNADIELHPSRVFILAEGATGGGIFGVPALEAGYNDLLDMVKTLVAGSEGNYKNSKQRLVHNINDSQVAGVMANDSKAKAAWEQSNADFASGFDSSLVTYGITTQSLQAMISDPTPAFTNSLNSFAASVGLPASEVIGVQMNKQASEGNATALNELAESVRENTHTPYLKKCLMYYVDRGIIAKPTNKILVEWESLSEPTFGEKVENMKKLAETAKILTDAGRDPSFVINAEAHIMKELDIEDVVTARDLLDFGEDDDLIDEELPAKDDV